MKFVEFEIWEKGFDDNGVGIYELVVDGLTEWNAIETLKSWKNKHPDSLVFLTDTTVWRDMFDEYYDAEGGF